jgi:trk system potassium uptake protein TrkA
VRVIVVGAGVLGFHVAKRLSEEGRDVVVVDAHEDQLRRVEEFLDVGVVLGKGSTPSVLLEAGLKSSDMIVAVTGSDETNIVACLLAQTLSPQTVRVARLRDPAYRGADGIIGQSALNIGLVISPEEEVARTVRLLAETPGASDVMEFAGGKVKVLGVQVGPQCPLLDRTIAELRADADGTFLVAGVYRRDMVSAPAGELRIATGDTLFFVTTPDQVRRLMAKLGKRWVHTRHAMISGGGRMGALIAARLSAMGIHTKLVESDRATCERLTEELKDTVVLHGHGVDQALLAEEGIARTDLFISAVEDEEENVFTALLAKRLGAARVVSLVDTPAYMPFASGSGVDVVLSPMLAALAPILQFVRRGHVVSVATLREEIVEGIEFVATQRAEILGQPLEQVHMPRGSMIGAVVRNGEVIIPDGSTVINEGDRVVLFARPMLIPRLERLMALGGKNGD